MAAKLRRLATEAWRLWTESSLMNDPVAWVACQQALAAAESEVIEVPVLIVGAGPTGAVDADRRAIGTKGGELEFATLCGAVASGSHAHLPALPTVRLYA